MKKKMTTEEASQRWIREGKTYKDAINAWLDIIYLEGKQPDTPEPKETRQDMAKYVMDQVEEFNKRGEYEKLRALFPPDNEPLYELLDDHYPCINKVMTLPDGRIIVKSGNKCYAIKEHTITELPAVFAFGSSADKKHFTKAFKDTIAVYTDWDGEAIYTLAYPDGYGEDFEKQYPHKRINKKVFNGKDLLIRDMAVFADGKRVLLTTHRGIFVITGDGYQLIHPFIPSFIDNKEDDEPWIFWPKNTDDSKAFALSLHYPHADLSRDDQYIATGSQDSCHIVLREKNGKWIETAWIEPRSSYPNAAKFNYRTSANDGNALPTLALSSCHFSQSATIGVFVKDLPGLEASGYDMDHDSLWSIDDRFWMHSLLDGKNTFVLGTNTGYIWIKLFHNDTEYLHVGGTITTMDITDDRQLLVVGTSLGQVIKLKYSPNSDLAENKNCRVDPYLITNTLWVDDKRYLFPSKKQPLIW